MTKHKHYVFAAPGATVICDYYGWRKSRLWTCTNTIEEVTCLHCLKAINADRSFTKWGRTKAFLRYVKLTS